MHMLSGVDEIQDRLEAGEVAAMNRPVVGQAIAYERLGGGREEATPFSYNERVRSSLVD